MIGYYVHHHGLGHLARALQISQELSRQGQEVVGLSSAARPAGWPGRWIHLPTDETLSPTQPEAGGVLHWAPEHHSGLRARMLTISRHLEGLSLMVVDVSVEVALLARLFGVPTVVVAMRGDRSDRPHLAAYDSASALLAPWEERFGEKWWPERWNTKTHFIGAMSRFDHRVPPRPDHVADRRVLGVWGGGGSDLPVDAVATARVASPGWRWVWRSPAHPSPDLWADLHGCDVVVCHAGNNTVAEVAAARRPAVVVAQPRPFDEQLHTVAAIRDAGLAVALNSWPPAQSWPHLLEEALRLGGDGWARWNRGCGARRAAEVLLQLATKETR